jgi:predicted Fe-S protein YdhL (DUF1289 family)
VSEPAPVSPCIGVCVLDPATQYCIGCARTIAEIAAWPRLSADEKQRVMALLPSRRPRARGSHARTRSGPG